MSRLWRTVRPLTASQLCHRVRLRSREAFRIRAPRLSARWRRRSAGPAPRVTERPALPADLLRPCDAAVTEARAADAARGIFTFLGERRELSMRPFPAPANAGLLWAYHLEYMEYLGDLGDTGRTEALDSLVRARLDAEGTGGRAATHPYPTSRRTVSLCRELRRSDRAARVGLAEGAWLGARHVAANLERDVGGNHLLENGLALAHAGSLFPGPGGERMRALGERILRAGASDQVGADGAHYELSAQYHARVLSVLLEGGVVLGEAGRSPGGRYWDAVARMISFLRDVLDPEGELPLLGDSGRDEGLEGPRLVRAAEARCPFPTPATARGDRGYENAGWFVLEDRAERHRLLVDAGPVAPPRLPAHGQADTFTYELHVGGRPMVVDAGVYEYAAGEMRDYARSTRAHSTVEVDGLDSSEVWSSFRIGRRARVRRRTFGIRDGLGTLRAEHDGYGHLGVVHGRTVSHLAPGLWLVVDALGARGKHRYASRIHLHPEAILSRPDPRRFTVHLAGATLDVLPFGGDRASVEEGWHSPSFGVRRRGPVLRFDATGGDRVFGYLLAAGGGPAPLVALREGMVEVERGGSRFARSAP